MLTELLAQYLPGKRCRIIAGGNRMGEHPPAPILDAKLAADNAEPALRNYATKALHHSRSDGFGLDKNHLRYRRWKAREGPAGTPRISYFLHYLRM
jgi:hypothetical protein